MNDKFIKLSMNAGSLSRLCWIFFLYPIFLYLLINIIYSGYEQFWNNIFSTDLLAFIELSLAVYLAHESLHVMGALLSGVKPGSLNFYFDKTTFSLECVCSDGMSVLGYQVFLLLPFLILTPVLAGLAYVSGSHLFAQVLVVSIAGCTFDLTTAIGLIGIPLRTRIIPELTGKNGYLYLRSAQ